MNVDRRLRRFRLLLRVRFVDFDHLSVGRQNRGQAWCQCLCALVFSVGFQKSFLVQRSALVVWVQRLSGSHRNNLWLL